MTTTKTRGEEFAEQVRSDYALNPAEDVLVDAIAGTLDVLEISGLSVAETRQQRNLLRALIAQLALPEVGETPESRRSETTRKASRAARARWQREAI